MRIPRPLALLSTRLRLRLRSLDLRHLRQRTIFMIIFCGLLLLMVSGYLWWYLPHRPSALVSQAVLKSLQQPGANFTLHTDGDSSFSLDGQIDKDGDTSFNIDKQGQRLTMRTVGGTNYLKGADGQWLSLPASMTQSPLPIAGSSIQSGNLERVNREQLKKLYFEHPFIVVNAVFDDEMIAGSRSNHYQVAINKHQLRLFLQAVQQDMPKLNIQKDQIDSVLNTSIIGRPLGIWVDAQDGLLRQVSYAASDSTTVITFTAYGQTGDITKPQAAKDLMTTLQR